MPRYDEVYRALAREPEAFWARRGGGDRLGRALAARPRRLARAVLPLVPRRPAEHVLQRARPARRARPRRPARADLRLAGHRHDGDVHLPRAPRRGRAVRRRARRAGRRARRPGDRLHADGSRGGRSRCSRARGSAPSTRSSSAGSPRTSSRAGSRTRSRRWSSRPRAGSSRRRVVAVQAAARRGDRAGRARSPSAASSSSGRQLEAELVAGRDVEWDEAVAGAEPADCVAGRGDRPALHPLHVGDDRAAEGDRARQRRPRGRARVVDEEHLRRRAGRGVLGGVGHRLGRRALVHRLRAAPPRLHDGALRGQAGRHARRRRVLARDRASTASRRSSPRRRRSARSASRIRRASSSADYDLSRLPRALPRGRALRPRDAALGRGEARRAGDRPLVADGDRLADRRELPRDRAAAGRSPGSPTRAGAGLGPARARRERRRGRRGRDRRARREAADAARAPRRRSGTRTSASARRTSRVPGLLPDRRRRLHRRGRLRLRDGAHRRHHQRRRPPALDRRDRGGARRAPRRRRVRGDRRRRRAQGPASGRASSC